MTDDSPTAREMEEAASRLRSMTLMLMHDVECIAQVYSEKKKAIVQGYAHELIECMSMLRSHLKDPSSGVSKTDGFVLCVSNRELLFTQVDMTQSNVLKNHPLPNPCDENDLHGVVLYNVAAIELAKNIHHGLSVVADKIRNDILRCKREEVFRYFIEW